MKKVSILMPVYNAVKYIDSSIAAALSQTYSNFELLVVDDGSDDGSGDLLEKHAARDGRIRLVRRENRGLVATRNELLEAATGELIAWMDADDVSLPSRLSVQVEAMLKDPDLVCVGGTVILVDADNYPLEIRKFPPSLDRDRHLRSQWTELPFCASTMRTSAARSVGGFREPFDVGEDFDLLVRLIEIGKIANVPEPVVRYRQHLDSVSSPSQLGRKWQSYCQVILDLTEERRATGSDRLQRGESVTLPEVEEAEHDPDPLSIAHARWGRVALGNGFRRTAFRHAIRSVQAEPFGLVGWKLLARVMLGR